MKLKVYYTEEYYDRAYWGKEYEWEKVYDKLVMDSDGDFYFIHNGWRDEGDVWVSVYEYFRVEVKWDE